MILSSNIPYLFSNGSQEIFNREDFKCLQLIPELVNPLAVEFAVPNNFVAKSLIGEPNPCDWIYWGPAEVLAKYFNNPDSLDQPLIRLKLSTNVLQSEMHNLSALKAAGIETLSSSKLNWGMYPLQEVEIKIDDTYVYTAWVGFNDPNETTLIFNLVYPKNKPSKQDLNFWRTFLKKTTQLPEQQLYAVLGQELQQGLTIATCNAAWNTAKIKAVAERRREDGKLQIALIPISNNLEIQCTEFEKGFKGGEWEMGKPLVKLYCQVIENVNKNYTNHFSKVISILEKEVEDFSFSIEDCEIAWMSE
ncbi:MAG: hypothetical protein S4CHLAM123_08060 [Chlamydiales bacterium]|nr:hypothetical protein [Chlamydiales bacterium]